MALVDRLTLPEPVRERLARALDRERLTEAPLPGVFAPVRRTNGFEESRLAERVELRVEDEDGAPHLTGYASVFDVPYDIAGGPPYGWTETIKPGTFTKALRDGDDTRLLIEHEGLPIARTKSKTLMLSQDDVGLYSDAPALDLRNPDVQRLRSAMERGDADEMSFAFRVTRQEWNDDYTERDVLEVRLFDVSVVTYPANPATSVMLRGDEAAAAAIAAASADVSELATFTSSTRQARAIALRYASKRPA